MLKLASLLCFIVAGLLIWQRHASLPLLPTEPAGESGIPVSISIPNLNLQLPILTEPLTTKGLTYEQHGSNLVLYGHNWPNILGHLKNTRPGQEIKLAYADNQTRMFLISEIKVVGPNATEILEPSTSDQLTLYTCTGFLDSKRLVITARPVDSPTD